MRAPRPPLLLVAAVLALHLLLGREVQRLHDGWVRDGPPPMPPRLQVEFVREMAMQVPPARSRPPPPAPAARRPAPEAAAPEPPASAPEPVPEPVPAPEPQPELMPASAPGALAAAAAPPASAAGPEAPPEPGPEWPLSTRLSYRLTGYYRGEVHGQAQVEWLRRGHDYQVHLDVDVGPGFAPLITRRMSSQGRLTPQGIAPQRYDEATRVLVGEGRRASVFFQGGEVQLASGARQPVPAGAQDSTSQFVQLTWLFLTGREPLQAGHRVRFPLVLPQRQYAWTYEVVGEAAVDTPLGPVLAWHLRPVRPPGGGVLAAEVWLAPSLQYLPVRLVIRQDAQTHIDLRLQHAPLQAAPESPDDSPRRPPP
ncbi:MAG: DUF3108 domain-containing protein [Roseateles sp.]|uniref:DUF3108 domain-containing protein n=1 Tax=Roseateles sp. TaxID=1971397 RepID=UPI0039EBC2C1